MNVSSYSNSAMITRSSAGVCFQKKRGRLKGAWLFALVTALLFLLPGAKVQAQVTAVRANDFLESICVNTKISQGINSPADVSTLITYAGIRNIRDDGQNIPGLISVHNTTGAKICLLPANGNIATTLSRLNQLAAAGALLAAEGPNEPNNWPVTYLGQTSSPTTSLPIAWFCRDLYAAVKADPNLSGYPVFASSEAGGSEPDNCGLQFLTIPSGAGTLMPDGTIYGDFANTHNYVCGNLSAIVDNNAWKASDPTLNSSWDGLYVEYGHTWWSPGYNGYTNAQLLTLPRVTTETGWQTQGPKSITEAQQGKILLNLYLAAYKRSWKYTFVYQLTDFAPYSEYWGLFHQDKTPKLSATYLHNLTTILADTGSGTPGTMNYSIPGQPATMHDLLIQKSGGQFELAVWNERASGSDSVTVNLGATYTTVKVYDPTVGTSPIQTLSNVNSVPLTLSDHPVIIEPIGMVTGGGGGATTIVATTFVPTGSRQSLNGTQIGLTTNLPLGNWVWGAGWNWGSPYVPATWDAAPQAVANLAEEKTALAVSLNSAGSYTKPTQIHLGADIAVTGANGGGLGFWSAMPARTDGGSSLPGFTGLVVLLNGNLQLYANGVASGSPVATSALTAGTYYPLSYDVNTTTGAISNILFNGNTITGISSTAFTHAATTFVGALSGAGARVQTKSFTVTSVGSGGGGGSTGNILATTFTSTGSAQPLNATILGLTTNQPGGNWIWGAGWNWGAPAIPSTSSSPNQCANLMEEKTVLGHSLASSGSYVKPAHLRIVADIALDTARANGGGLGYWSAIPARTDGLTSLTGFTGLNLKSNGTLQVYVNGTATGSAVAVGTLTNWTFYTLSYDIDTASGALSNVVFNGTPVTGLSSTGFTNAATAYAGMMSSSAARAQMRNFTVSSW